LLLSTGCPYSDIPAGTPPRLWLSTCHVKVRHEYVLCAPFAVVVQEHRSGKSHPDDVDVKQRGDAVAGGADAATTDADAIVVPAPAKTGDLDAE